MCEQNLYIFGRKMRQNNKGLGICIEESQTDLILFRNFLLKDKKMKEMHKLEMAMDQDLNRQMQTMMKKSYIMGQKVLILFRNVLLNDKRMTELHKPQEGKETKNMVTFLELTMDQDLNHQMQMMMKKSCIMGQKVFWCWLFLYLFAFWLLWQLYPLSLTILQIKKEHTCKTFLRFLDKYLHTSKSKLVQRRLLPWHIQISSL